MSKTLAIVGSNNKESINKKLAVLALSKLDGDSNEIMDLVDLNAPIYSPDLEMASGVPAEIKAVFDKLSEYDSIILATPEHNGYLPAVFKNLLDWLSRTDGKFMQGKPVLLLSTSLGAQAGARSLGSLELFDEVF
ncbi:MAG: NAD(P)H-dependent oxidoreductase [Flavobacteriales bacterium]|nr:NAD(P)H-dependent oxidoreductase [Flavobacteriales bacterium]